MPDPPHRCSAPPRGGSPPADPRALLLRHFGYTAFRPGQEDLVRAALAGRDALGVLPTGGGKSICYQVPALALGGLTLVVTPLISLMEDQVRRALEGGVRAAHLSAGQEPSVKRSTLEQARTGGLDLLFVAPERLGLGGFLEAVKADGVRLLAVDEAHCISEWGHDFRPHYRDIGALRQRLRAPVLALTATATPHVRDDVAASLRLRDPLVIVRSFDRPNLSWAVRPGGSHRRRALAVGRLLRRVPGSAIVYAPTRRTVDDVRDALAGLGVRTDAYHAGLTAAERTRVQGAFMAGECRVVVATNAFGMGIDKADVRLVAHIQLPASLEAYYQEAGRAGRDGEPAWCVAFHDPSDGALARSFLDAAHPPRRMLVRLHRALRRVADPSGEVFIGVGTPPSELTAVCPEERLRGALAALARAGTVRVLDGAGAGVGWGSGDDGDESSMCEGAHSPTVRLGVRPSLDVDLPARLRRAGLDKLRAVRRYGDTRSCRRRALLGYFGEEAPRRCGACDRCFTSNGDHPRQRPLWAEL